MAKEYEELRNAVYENRPIIVRNFVRDLLYGYIRDEAEIVQKAKFLSLDFENHCFRIIYIEINMDDITAKTDSLTEKAEVRYVVSFKVREIMQNITS